MQRKVSDEVALNGLLFVLHTGIAWENLPQRAADWWHATRIRECAARAIRSKAEAITEKILKEWIAERQIRHVGDAIGQAQGKVGMAMMATYSNLKRLTSFLERGVDAFLKPVATKARARPQRAKA